MIVIIKSTTDYIFGGYTSTGFIKYNNHHKHTKDKDAFLFSIKLNNKKCKPKIFQIKNDKTDYAIYYNKGYLFSFGYSGNDIWIHSHCNKAGTWNGCFGESYDMPKKYLIGGINKLIIVDNMEVFKLSI